MSKRLYICDVLHNEDQSEYWPAVDAVTPNWSAIMPTGPDGRPLFTWALVIVASKDHAELRNKPSIDPLPDFPLDGKVNAINAATKGLMKAALVRRGLNADAIVDGKDGYREVVRGIGRALDAAFDENKFDITDV